MDAILQETKVIIQTALPYLIASRSIDPIIGISLLPLIVIIFEIMKLLYEKIKNKMNNTIKISYSYDRRNGDAHNDNTDKILYMAINSYLVDNQPNKVKHYMAKLKDNNNEEDERDYDINFITDTNFKMEIEFENKIIKINAYIENDSKETVSVKVIEFTGDIENIKKFIKYVYDASLEKKVTRSYIIQYNEWTKREIYNCKTFNNLFLDSLDKNKLINMIDSFKQSEEVRKNLGIPFKLGMMFYGVPGCGKSSTVYAIAKYMDTNVYHVNLSNYTSGTKFIRDISDIPSGAVVVFNDIDCMCIKKRDTKKPNIEKIMQEITGKILIDDKNTSFRREIIHQIRKKKIDIDGFESFIDIDEEIANQFIKRFIINKENKDIYEIIKRNLDMYYDGTEKLMNKYDFVEPDEDEYDDDEVPDFTSAIQSALDLQTILHVLDGYEYLHKCIIVFTTNYPDKLDSALIRPGRIDFQFNFKPAHLDVINEAFKYSYKQELIDILTEEEKIKLQDIEIQQSELMNCIIIPNIKNIENAKRDILNCCK